MWHQTVTEYTLSVCCIWRLLLTICLCVIGCLSLFDVLIKVWLLLGVALPAVVSTILAALHCTQSLVNMFIVVACRPLVVGLTRFSFEALEWYRKFKWSGKIDWRKKEGRLVDVLRQVVPESCSDSASVKPFLLSASTGAPLIGWHQRLRSHAPNKPEQWNYIGFHLLYGDSPPPSLDKWKNYHIQYHIQIPYSLP